MSRRRPSGFSLMEMVVAIALLGIFLLVLVALESEMFRLERSIRINMMSHPDPTAVLSRLRRDVLDSHGYPEAIDGHEQSESTLILLGLAEDGAWETIAWDFSEEGVARRITYRSGEKVGEWTAGNVPVFTIASFDMPDGGVAVRVQARHGGKLAIDGIFQPRIHG
ncbi:MAG TPA: prepilin-type N-terminal cleavage/methylation domain-containing protein [Thermoanaerobaculia bacterium]|nr:prepilin-type N-terminal cleavage/methylation domain-containing protein [Thermoanaerobaculia bacterium]